MSEEVVHRGGQRDAPDGVRPGMPDGVGHGMPVVYLDNAATSWPKPPQVAEAMCAFLAEVGANPGRSGHRRSVEAARVVHRARTGVARLLGLDDPLRVVFCANATHALNLALRGLLGPGRHVVTTSIEHNSVMRPLRALEAEGSRVTVVPCSPQGILDPADVERALTPETAMIVATQASNVLGTLLPIRELGSIARAHDLLLLVDGAQSLGALPMSLDDLGIDLLAFTGHKALLGPMGTGGLVVGPRVDLSRFEPLMRGGTGSRSESQVQPDFLPDKFESGTPNVVGLAGLAAAVEWLLARGVAEVRAREDALTASLLAGLGEIRGVEIYGPRDAGRQLSTVSFTLAGMAPDETGRRLDDEYGIAVRVGLHCSPIAHETMGTHPVGTVRISLGAFTTEADVAAVVRAVAALAEGGGR